MRRVTTVAELRAAVADARATGRTISLVPTMGAIHEGHLALVRAAAGDPDASLPFLVVSVFVNPLQFAPGEDYEGYPRDLDADEERLDALGDAAPDLVWAPSVQEMYPGFEPGAPLPILTTVSVTGLTAGLCGASRPGHFDGVTTVVSKLFHQVQPDRAYFGRKDFQQLQVLRRMVADLDLPVEVVGVPTVREPDGLARSSRNAYLSDDERRAARVLSRGLAAAVGQARAALAEGRAPDPARLRDVAAATIADEPLARIDYVEVVDPGTLAHPDDSGEASELLVAVAVHVGPARLIDNVVIGDEADEARLLAATR